MISPNVRKDGFQHPGIFGLWNPESGKVLLVKSKILGFGICDSTQGIRNPADGWNPDESIPKNSTWNVVPQRGIQNPRLSWIPLLCQEKSREVALCG